MVFPLFFSLGLCPLLSSIFQTFLLKQLDESNKTIQK
jgi:hypothetical protein